MRRIVVLSVLLLVAGVLAGCPGKAPPGGDAVGRCTGGEIADYLERSSLDEVRAVLVIVDDRTVIEEYYDTSADEFRNVYSVTKSVLSTLVGIAIDEGLLELADPLRELLPAYAGAMSPEVAVTTLEQLLTMSGGFPDRRTTLRRDSVFEQPDWVAACLGSAVRPAGGGFAYSDPGTHLVAAVLAHATGRTVLEYARDKLFEPLGVDTDPAAEPPATAEGLVEYDAAELAWLVDPQGCTGVRLPQLRPRTWPPWEPLPARWHRERRAGGLGALDARRDERARARPRRRRRLRLPVVDRRGRRLTRVSSVESGASWSRSCRSGTSSSPCPQRSTAT